MKVNCFPQNKSPALQLGTQIWWGCRSSNQKPVSDQGYVTPGCHSSSAYSSANIHTHRWSNSTSQCLVRVVSQGTHELDTQGGLAALAQHQWYQGTHHHRSFSCWSSDQDVPWAGLGPLQQHPEFHTWHQQPATSHVVLLILGGWAVYQQKNLTKNVLPIKEQHLQKV